MKKRVIFTLNRSTVEKLETLPDGKRSAFVCFLVKRAGKEELIEFKKQLKEEKSWP